MRKDTPSVLLERVMPAAGVIQSARLGCPGTNYSERGSTEPSERRHQTRPCQRGHPWILDRPAARAEPRRASATGYSLRRYQILTTPLPFQSSKHLGLRIVVIVVGVTDCLITTDIASEFLISIGWHCCKGKGGDGGKCCNRLARHGDI